MKTKDIGREKLILVKKIIAKYKLKSANWILLSIKSLNVDFLAFIHLHPVYYNIFKLYIKFKTYFMYVSKFYN